jgi:hypothetical protein
LQFPLFVKGWPAKIPSASMNTSLFNDPRAESQDPPINTRLGQPALVENTSTGVS